MPVEWSSIEGSSGYMMCVPGGWLLRSGSTVGLTVTFISDKSHHWAEAREICNLPVKGERPSPPPPMPPRPPPARKTRDW